MTKLTESYQDYLLERLQDPEEAAAYLNAAIEENDDRVFSLALQNVAEAQRMVKSATMADLNPKRVNQILSEQGSLQLSSLTPLLDALGLRLSVLVKEKSA
jgi:probable addiction module antidote protein